LASYPMSNRMPCAASALAQVSTALHEAGKTLRAVIRAIEGYIDLDALQQGLIRMKSVAVRLTDVRNQVWLQQYEARLDRTGGPPLQGEDRGAKGVAG
jgi:hypothetical protein